MTTITGASTFRDIVRISRAKFTADLADTPAAAVASAVWDYCVAVKIDALYLAAIFNAESSRGKAGWAVKTHSWGNTRTPNFGPAPVGIYEQDNGNFHPWTSAYAEGDGIPPRVLCAYKDWFDGGISTAARLTIGAGYVYATRTKIAEVYAHPSGAVWAPAGDGNDPNGYLNRVLAYMNAHTDGERPIIDIIHSGGGPIVPDQLTDHILLMPPSNKNWWQENMPSDPHWITVHETGNLDPDATAEMHAKYVRDGGGRNIEQGGINEGVSFHAVVDETGSWQLLPWRARGFHAGDVRGDGGMWSIGIETVQVGDFAKTIANLSVLVRRLQATFNIDDAHVVQHNHWTGKNCPEYLRSGKLPLTGKPGPTWTGFMAGLAVTNPLPPVGDESKRLMAAYRALPPFLQGGETNTIFYECGLDFSALTGAPVVKGHGLHTEYVTLWTAPGRAVTALQPETFLSLVANGKVQKF